MPKGKRRPNNGGGASWTTDSRWQVRLMDAEGDPITTWRWAETLAECRQDFIESVDAVTAEVKHDGHVYGVLYRLEHGAKMTRQKDKR